MSTPTSTPSDSEYWFDRISERDAAAFLNLSLSAMKEMRCQLKSPPFARDDSGNPRYRRLDLWTWADQRNWCKQIEIFR